MVVWPHNYYSLVIISNYVTIMTSFVRVSRGISNAELHKLAVHNSSLQNIMQCSTVILVYIGQIKF